ncbi:hypothetical protein NKJ72_05140 [Mesorhizobium sp. M0045]|uniref:hypothetical protein n=1 Tax=Mesorhizobium sp. M0045 TaxID=2956857 RepID=UPI003337B98E
MNKPFSVGPSLSLMRQVRRPIGHDAGVCRTSTQRLMAAAQPVQKPPGSLWILGGKAVHNTTCCGEQTKKLRLSLIRRRFVPALSGTLTARAENTLEMIKAR